MQLVLSCLSWQNVYVYPRPIIIILDSLFLSSNNYSGCFTYQIAGQGIRQLSCKHLLQKCTPHPHPQNNNTTNKKKERKKNKETIHNKLKKNIFFTLVQTGGKTGGRKKGLSSCHGAVLPELINYGCENNRPISGLRGCLHSPAVNCCPFPLIKWR